MEGFYFRPRIDRELLEKHSDGLVILSGCTGEKTLDPPVVTDEFDRFLVTKATQIGDVIDLFPYKIR